MNKTLEYIEARLRSVFEDKLFALIPGNDSHKHLFTQVQKAIANNIKTDSEGEILAPDNIIIFVPGEDLPEWQAHQDVLAEMASFLVIYGHTQGYHFNQHPRIRIKTKDFSSALGYTIAVDYSPDRQKLPDTAAMSNDELSYDNEYIPEKAFLIVGGKENFPLERPVTDIGRHSDNHLILDESHVSRHHAQIRVINKRFVIFDVGSTGGLFINGKQISQATLQTGDVIRMGMVNLIFVQDTTSENPTTAFPVEDN